MNWLEESFGLRLADPHWLTGLLAIPLCMLLAGRIGRRPAIVFPGVSALRESGYASRVRAGGIALSLLYLSMAVATLALARPQIVRSHEKLNASGIDIIIALDVSLSMNIEDFFIQQRRVNRLLAAKKVMRQFVEGRPNDRIGIVAFGGRPFSVSPLTLDHDWIADGIDRVRIGLVEDGTAIGSAIALASTRLYDQKAKSKIIVLVTDGANNSGKLTPADAAKFAKTMGVKIYAISVGTPGRHPIPLADGSGRVIAGVEQNFDTSTLRQVASTTDGAFYRAEDMGSLEEIFKTIDQLEKSEIVQRKIVKTKDLFPWFVVGAIIIGIFAIVFSHLIAFRIAP